MDRIRVGFIGAGQISELHARAYRGDSSADLAAVADADASVAESRAAEYGADRWFTDYRALLDDPDIDAVEILLPHHLHLPATLDALDAGKHVSLQKPMAISMAEADQMIEAAGRTDRLFRVFENFRSYEPYIRARQLIESGEIGEPLSIRVKTISGNGVGGWTQPESARKWRYDPATGGGPPAILDHGYHMTSIVMFFMGEVERVHAMVDTTAAGTPEYSGSPAMIMWKHAGAHKYGTWETTRAPDLMIRTQYYPGDEWLEVTGSRGIVWVTHCSANMLGRPPVVLHRDGETLEFDDMETDWGESFARGGREFVEAIRDGTQPDLNGSDARHALAFSFAAIISAAEDRTVALAEL